MQEKQSTLNVCRMLTGREFSHARAVSKKWERKTLLTNMCKQTSAAMKTLYADKDTVLDKTFTRTFDAKRREHFFSNCR